ncbi:TadE/TadG family type IV pilus assembly protein [Nitrosomonas sp. Nm132]|uniref:TadE/TadG family type IV pilus assembly protein n=1 Tax=Nitrosomonas sp. Nm132 TaxID=1881053 RepID=UPI0008899340|nr:TadE/TadG family type IV pilus assembly protein [Nitrosomonas sp. Nm132]SDH42464.1 TadE-like protein [Nitrosomonas sp. Nm132]
MHRQHYTLPKAMRGAVAVEFALLIPLLLALALGAAEFGRALYQYNTLVKATRDAVRHLSQFNPADTLTYSKEKSNAECLAVYGKTECKGDPLVPGLTTDLVFICDSINTENGCKTIDNYANVSTDAGSKINLVEVGITRYIFNFILDPRTFLGGGENSLTFGDIRATMRQS